jgi:hypothetical protein
MSDTTPEGPREGGANRHPEDDLTGEFEIPAQPLSAYEHINTAPTDAAPTDAGGDESADESIAVTRDGEATVQHPSVEPAEAEPAEAAPSAVERAEAAPTEVEPAAVGTDDATPEAPGEAVPAEPEPEPEPAAEPAHQHPVTEVYDEAPRAAPAWAPEPPAAGGTGATAVAQPAGPVYVTAPTAPKRRGNRGAGILIALLAALVFAVVDALVVLAIFALNQQGNVIDDLVRYIATPAFWATAIIYALALFLLVAIANRGGWWWYVLGGFLVAVVVYFAYIGATLLTNAWVLAPSEVGRFVSQLWSHPLTIATAVVAREVTIWFGAWIAARGRRVRARNLDAREAYDRDVAESQQSRQQQVAARP